MRTDNAFLSEEGASACRKAIIDQCGKIYLGPEGQHQETTGGEKKTKAKDKKVTPEAQAAHEAIRPTHPEIKSVIDLGAFEAKIYSLIWTRALQSQMAPSTEDCRGLTFTIDTDKEQAHWFAEQIKSKFLGYKILNTTDKTETNQKDLQVVWDLWKNVIANMIARWLQIEAEESFTKAQSRFTEASLIHELEAKGIGRPSTFASLVTTIVDRNYVEKSDSAGTKLDIRRWTIDKPNMWPPTEVKLKQTVGKESNKLQVTPLGRTVAEFIYKHYNDIFAYEYTSNMEQKFIVF
jgi:DNA topoisomerase-1